MSISTQSSNDAKLFARGKIQELRQELTAEKKDSSKHAKRKIALKKIVANMTMGNDMGPLFPDVVGCMSIPVMEVKKMVYLYLINYAKSKPELAVMAANGFVRDVSSPNPLIRGLTIRTMSYINVDKIMESLVEPLQFCLKDRDPYVCKSAAIAVAKLYMYDAPLVERLGLLSSLQNLINHENPTVVSNAVAALTEISDRSETFDLRFDLTIASKLMTAIEGCNEWGQTYILESLMNYVPQESNDAELLADRIIPRLQHTNSAIILAACRVILYLTNYIADDAVVNTFYKKVGAPLVTLLSSGPEVQYVALRNILLILQKYPSFLRSDLKVFFCKYNDPIYVKLTKLEIIFFLAGDANVDQVLPELKEYATEVDVDFVRKAVRCIGRCAIKIESSSDRCMQALVELVETGVNYVVQEAVVVIKDIFRRYPNRYESVISKLCDNLGSLDESEAKASMIWIVGQYAERIENADELLEKFFQDITDDPCEVHLALLTAVVKLFIKRPSAGQELVPKVLKWATEDVDNPDLRDRGFIYWRLLSTDPVAAKAIVLAEKPAISTETDRMGKSIHEDELMLHISTLASIYHKPASVFIGNFKPKRLLDSPALIRGRTFGKDTPGTAAPKLGAAPIPNINLPMDNDYTSGVSNLARVNAKSLQLLNFGDDEDHAFGGTTSNTLSSSNRNEFDNIDFFSDAPPPPSSQNSGNNNVGNNYYNQQVGQLNMSILNELDPLGLFNEYPSMSSVAPSAVASPVTLMGNNETFPSSPQLSNNRGVGGINVSNNAPPGAGTLSVISPTSLQSANNPFAPSAAKVNISSTSTAPSNINIPQSSFASAGNADVILDPFASSRLVTPPAIPATSLNNNNTSTLLPNLQNLSLNSTAATMNPSPLSPPVAISPTDCFVAPKTQFLSPLNGKGLEINGVFVRRMGRVFMDMTFSNRAMQPFNGFAILFNKNSFSLVPGTPLNATLQVIPNQNVDVSLPLSMDGAMVPTSPINNLQVALQTNAGILYFQTLIPLYVLYCENSKLDPDVWISTWRDVIPPTSEVITQTMIPSSSSTMNSGPPRDMIGMMKRLESNNVFTVASRILENMPTLFTSVRLSDGSIILTELKFDALFTSCSIKSKSLSPHLIHAHHSSLEQLILQIKG